jgi:hypothetical protein
MQVRSYRIKRHTNSFYISPFQSFLAVGAPQVPSKVLVHPHAQKMTPIFVNLYVDGFHEDTPDPFAQLPGR